MSYIQLSGGTQTLIDDENIEMLSQWKWHLNGGYAVGYRKYNGKAEYIKMHRFILNAPLDSLVDHVNGDRLDNRIVNIRFCDRLQNSQNRKCRKNSTSGYKGVLVFKNASFEGWQVRITVKGKKKFIGYFKEKILAAKAYDAAARKYFGEFARLNFA